MTRPAVDPTTWTSDPPGMFSYYRNGQHFRLAGRDLLEEVSFSSRDHDAALQLALALTTAASNAGSWLARVVSRHQHSADHAKRRLRQRGYEF